MNCSLSSGRLHVHPWWCCQHVWEPKDCLFVQSVAGCAQPAGIDLGKTAENLSSLGPAVHTAAAQPGPDTHTNSAAQINAVGGLKEEKHRLEELDHFDMQTS